MWTYYHSCMIHFSRGPTSVAYAVILALMIVAILTASAR